MKSPDLSVNICGVILKNPVVTASGTFGFGREYSEYFDLNRLGGIAVKGLTLKERIGNPPPRVAEAKMGMLNSVGLQNPGIEAFIKKELPFLKQFDTKIIANISGNTIEEYCEMASILGDNTVDLIEMNISCPNVAHGGVAFGVDEKMVYSITNRVKKHCKVPLIVKLSPNVTDIGKIALSAEAGGADGLSLINTFIGMVIDVKTRRPVLKNNIGGVSGPMVKPMAVRMVWEVKKKVKIPIIGMGGISCGNDALEFILAGANAVAIGTAGLVDPNCWVNTIDEITQFMIDNKINNISELVGSVRIHQ